MNPVYTLRPSRPEDLEFLLQVYAGTRAAELTLTDWSAEQKAAFVRQQFEAQDYHYRTHYVGASFDIIEIPSGPAGRLYVARWADEIRLMDIALLPQRCGQGLGGAVLRDLLAEGQQTGRPVSVHVERNNPALRLYERLGFRLAEDKGVYLFLKWTPPAPAAGE